MTPVDKINGDTKKAITLLTGALPSLFGPHSPQNTLKVLVTTPSIRNKLKMVQESKYKVHLIAKGEVIRKLGFPLDSVELILDTYTKQSWSFSVKCEVKNRAYFALEWNNELNFTLGNRTRSIKASYVLIDYQIVCPYFHPLDCRVHIGLKRNFMTDRIHHDVTWRTFDPKHPLTHAIRPKFSISNNMHYLKSNKFPNMGKMDYLGAVNLRIPICITFNPSHVSRSLDSARDDKRTTINTF